MLKVYLGSTNPVKIASCEAVLSPQGYQVIGLEVDSGVNHQPLTDQETMQGALNRALQLPPKTLRIGLEAGVEFHQNKLFLVNWGVMIDECDYQYWAGGTRIPLPDEFIEKIIKQKQELSDVMAQVYHKINIKHQEGAIGFFTKNFVRRVDIFTHLIKLLYGQYLKRMEDI